MRVVADSATFAAADREAARAVGEDVLIGRAAAAVATHAAAALGRVYGSRVCVLAGSGHNGADALRAGALLAARGAAVYAVRSSTREGDAHVTAAWAALRAAGGRERTEPGAADLVLDGMTGGGGRGALTGRAAELAAAVASTPTVAVDLPSGVEADTGAVPGACVRADVTVTFGALRPAHVVGPAAARCGQVVVADIGLAVPTGLLGVLDADDLLPLLADPPPDADKYSRGVVGVHAGGAAYPGAAVLSCGGAVRAGAGYVRYVGGAADAVRAAWPTVVAGDGRVDAWVVGPGLAGEGADLDGVRAVLDSDTAAVLDAGALAVGAEALRGRSAPTLVTPHAGEFERLTGIDPRPDPLGAARRVAADLGVHVLLKGWRTVVAAPDGRARITTTATSWLSTAGTGDVLAGACGALLAASVKASVRAGVQAGVQAGGQAAGTVAQDEPPDLLTVAAAAAFLHGLAGRYAPVPLSAADLLDSWSTACAVVRGGGPG